MNTQNYASLEASKRLHDAGIILETDAVWEGKEGQSWGDIAIILSREKGGLFPKPGYATGQKAAVNQF